MPESREPDVVEEWRREIRHHTRNCDTHDDGCMFNEEQSALDYIDGLTARLARIAEIVERAEKTWDGGFPGLTYADTYEILRLAKGD